jgi:CheY-like chemotaxis protein
MPVMSGVEVAREVREAEYDLYICGCSGNAMREDQVSGRCSVLPRVRIQLGSGCLSSSLGGDPLSYTLSEHVAHFPWPSLSSLEPYALPPLSPFLLPSGTE